LVVVDELDVVDPELLPGDDVVADDSEELLGGEAGGVVVVVVDSLFVVESTRVSGDAEGEGTTRSRSVTRSVLSVQPASTPTPSARTQKPVSNFFIVVPPVVDSNLRGWWLQRGCRRRAACCTLGAWREEKVTG
jgi:hypothetical protein